MRMKYWLVCVLPYATLHTPKSEYNLLSLSSSCIFADYPLLPIVLSSIRDLIVKPCIDLLTMGARCAQEFSVSGLGFGLLRWCWGMWQSQQCNIHHGGNTLCELYFQLSLLSFALLPCDEEEAEGRRVADARRGWHFVWRHMIERRQCWHWTVLC